MLESYEAVLDAGTDNQEHSLLAERLEVARENLDNARALLIGAQSDAAQASCKYDVREKELNAELRAQGLAGYGEIKPGYECLFRQGAPARRTTELFESLDDLLDLLDGSVLNHSSDCGCEMCETRTRAQSAVAAERYARTVTRKTGTR